MASIRFENVTKTYEGATSPVVPNLNLEIKDKEFIRSSRYIIPSTRPQDNLITA